MTLYPLDGYETGKIYANAVQCADTASKIEEELNNIPPLCLVTVSGSPSGADDGGCIWIVTFEGVSGNPALLHVTAFHGIQTAGPSTSVTVGAAPP